MDDENHPSPFLLSGNKQTFKPRFLLKNHLGKTLVKRCQILFAIAAEKLDVTQGLRILFFNGKAAVGILHVMGRGDDVIGDFKKILFIAAIRTF
jgi:hypothetical protein